MIVLIPSYKRTEILHWVIWSVLEADVQDIDERILVLIVNNFPPNRDTVESIIGGFRFEGEFACQAIHREKTLPAVESWQLAISQVAEEDEVIVLLGDDDLMLPWGLRNRYHQITSQKADMLVSDFCQRLYFFENGERCWHDFEIPTRPNPNDAVPWEYYPAKHPNVTFMSNHCYRNTPDFRKGWEAAMSWCRAQDWVPVDFATAPLPGYLPYAIRESGGDVISLHEIDVIRGSIADEAMFQDYSDGGNTAFYSLLIYSTFKNVVLHPDYEAFEELRRFHFDCFLSGMIGILGNQKISQETFFGTMRRSGVRFRDCLRLGFLKNGREFLRLLPGARGSQLRRMARNGKLEATREFLEMYSENRLPNV